MARTTPARAHFSAQYANPDYADLNLVIKAPVTTQHDTRKRHHGQPDECLTWQTTEYEDLVKQPGHKVVLCAAPHFKAQVCCSVGCCFGVLATRQSSLESV